mmetsp:Transcript_18424/g.47881  ORF Transcript_18424/g.47881 Transcript_18424/m.47881 type:complete len:342 (-) Transcript_18424:1358-2383(-)
MTALRLAMPWGLGSEGALGVGVGDAGKGVAGEGVAASSGLPSTENGDSRTNLDGEALEEGLESKAASPAPPLSEAYFEVLPLLPLLEAGEALEPCSGQTPLEVLRFGFGSDASPPTKEMEERVGPMLIPASSLDACLFSTPCSTSSSPKSKAGKFPHLTQFFSNMKVLGSSSRSRLPIFLPPDCQCLIPCLLYSLSNSLSRLLISNPRRKPAGESLNISWSLVVSTACLGRGRALAAALPSAMGLFGMIPRKARFVAGSTLLFERAQVFSRSGHALTSTRPRCRTTASLSRVKHRKSVQRSFCLSIKKSCASVGTFSFSLVNSKLKSFLGSRRTMSCLLIK